MANEYYTYTSDLVPGETVLSGFFDDELKAIEEAFDKLSNPGDLKVGANIGADDTGTANNYVVDNGGEDTLVDYQLTTFRPLTDNIGAAVIDVNSSGNKEIVRNDGSPLQAGDLLAGVPAMIIYDEDEDRWVMVGATSEQTQAAARPGINNQTGTAYTVVASDELKLIRCTNAAAITVTVPPESTTSLPIGFITHIYQAGAGQVTISPGSGVTIRHPTTLKTRVQYASLSLIKIATNEFQVVGDAG